MRKLVFLTERGASYYRLNEPHDYSKQKEMYWIWTLLTIYRIT